ncbi:hypothetical protein HAX54_012000, partial [Datura stramonium]|nr:hypothetical protein [Datura stramonium]
VSGRKRRCLLSRELVFLILQFLDEEKFKDAVHNLNWQHQLCKSPKPNPDIKTLFVDHSCGPSQPNGARAPSPVTHPLMGAVPKLSFSTSGSSCSYAKASEDSTNNSNRTLSTADSEHMLKRSRPFGVTDEGEGLLTEVSRFGILDTFSGFTGVAYSKHIAHLLLSWWGQILGNHLEIEAHSEVSTILSFPPYKQIWACYLWDDRLIKCINQEFLAHRCGCRPGLSNIPFEGHMSSLFSMSTSQRNLLLFSSLSSSTAIDGKIKAWLYDNMGSRVDYDAPGHSSTTMAYSAERNKASPCLRFNKEGMLLAVSTSDNGLKILANTEMVLGYLAVNKMLYMYAAAPTVGSFGPPALAASFVDRVVPMASMVTRLIYTNSGLAILALAANAVHKLEWFRILNPTGKVFVFITLTFKYGITTAHCAIPHRLNASVVPQLWQPSNGTLMTNDTIDTNPEEVVPCFALSKNDSALSTMTTFMPAPPAATFLAFHPQDNNVIAIGMDDSSIQIYNVRIDEEQISQVPFDIDVLLVESTNFNTYSALIILGKRQFSMNYLRAFVIVMFHLSKRLPHELSQADTVQFHQDQTQLLVAHEMIAIFEAPKLECLKQFQDASVGVLSASTLRWRCRINPTSYLPANPSSVVSTYTLHIHLIQISLHWTKREL